MKELIRCLDMPKTVVQPNDYGDQHKRKDKMSGPVELGKSDNNKESISQSGESPRDKEQDAAEESKENILIEVGKGCVCQRESKTRVIESNSDICMYVRETLIIFSFNSCV